MGEEYPPLWRIDGKTLLQKYEPFKSNGKTLYRNISTVILLIKVYNYVANMEVNVPSCNFIVLQYSGWAPQNRHIYQQVPVKFWQQGKMETIVEFLRDEMIVDDR